MGYDREARLAAFANMGAAVLAKDQPLEAEEIEAFLKSPQCLIPDGAVMFECIPGLRMGYDFHRNADGRLAFLRHNIGYTELVENGYVTRRLRSEIKDSTIELVDFIGREPLWLARPAVEIAECELMMGGTAIVREPQIRCVTVLFGGSIMFVHGTGMRWHVMRWSDQSIDRLPDDAAKHIKRFVQTPDGNIWVVRDSLNRTTGWVLGRMGEKHKIVCPNAFDLVMSEDGDARFIVAEGCDRNVTLWRFPYNDEPLYTHLSIGSVPYHSSCRQLPNAPWAYIGQAPHDRLRWVVNGHPRPAFRWVSPIFEDPMHGLCYWGVYGDWLITLKIL